MQKINANRAFAWSSLTKSTGLRANGHVGVLGNWLWTSTLIQVLQFHENILVYSY